MIFVRFDALPQMAACLVFMAALFSVTGHTPFWTVVIGVCCAMSGISRALGYPWMRSFKGARFLFGAVTALLVGGVFMSFRTLNGLEAGTALLVVMGALKVLESRSRRDDAIVIGVSLFMLLAAALASQSLSRIPLYLLVLWAACTAMMVVAHPRSGVPLRAMLRLSARALIMAVPLAAACFLFFPRIGGQFWALHGSGGATTGLSDEMSPGAIDRLVSDYEPAFRVRFTDPVPPPELRYWRGPVLNSFDGFTWRRDRRGYVETPLEMLGDAIRYRVTIEPTHRNWVFALDTIDRSPRHNIFMTHDRQLYRSQPITEPLTFDASSHVRTRALGPLSIAGRRYETRLPEGRNPRAVALAQSLRRQAADDATYARNVLDWFRGNGLEYTFEPEPTGLEAVDSVLFDTKRGFCGHFASAYATMMRAVGVPARVVTGYLGGEWNPVGSYLIVRQSDAHAWTEIWLDGVGWTRVDPTSVVAPERLLRGVYDVVADGTSVGISLRRFAWLAKFAQYWDNANTWWRERVVEFNFRSQLDLLSRLGIEVPGWRHLGWAFAAGLVLWLLWVTSTLRRSVARNKPDRIARAWLRATRKLAKVATARAPDEGALSYARRVAAQHPHLADRVMDLAERYVKLRFGPEAANEEIAALERDVRKLGSLPNC